MGAKLRLDNNNTNKLTFKCTQEHPVNGVITETDTASNTISFTGFFFDNVQNLNDLKCEDGKGLQNYDSRGECFVASPIQLVLR